MTEQQVLKRCENALQTVNRVINIVDELYTGANPAYDDEEEAVVLRAVVPASGVEITGKHRSAAILRSCSIINRYREEVSIAILFEM